jgi:hypothetical protein
MPHLVLKIFNPGFLLSPIKVTKLQDLRVEDMITLQLSRKHQRDMIQCTIQFTKNFPLTRTAQMRLQTLKCPTPSLVINSAYLRRHQTSSLQKYPRSTDSAKEQVDISESKENGNGHSRTHQVTFQHIFHSRVYEWCDISWLRLLRCLPESQICARIVLLHLGGRAIVEFADD